MHNKKSIHSHYHIIYPVFLMIFITLGVTVAVNQSQKSQNLETHAAITNCTVPTTHLSIKTQEKQLFDAINNYRKAQGLNALSWSDTLKQSATWQSLDMLSHTRMSHTDSLGRTPDIRLANCGYHIEKGYGENIAEGSSSASLIFAAWENDPSHRQILLNPSYTITGIDVEQNSIGKNVFWTMDLGTATSISPTETSVAPSSTVTISDAPSDAVPSVSQSPSESAPTTGPVAADMLLSITITINGIGKDGNITPKHLTRKVTAFVYDTSTTPVTTGTGFLNYDNAGSFTGVIHLGQLAQGSYLVKLVSDNTLQVLAQPAFQTLLINKENSIPTVNFYQGDLNGDNVLDINDYNSALPCFQSSTCSTQALDFNDDSTINVLDYNLLLQSYAVLHGD